ncbi:MAG: hypothetical protein OXF93_23265 [Acidobacteria bacterium]|nr:hypothetical protein [Acidobacteriota bacterium]
MLVERDEQRGIGYVPGHQVDEVDEVGRASDRLDGARVGGRGDGVRAEELAAEGDERGFAFAQAGDGAAVADCAFR